MSYFSRLTDIVTCNLSAILAEAADPATTLDEILVEMEEGLAGAQRSVATAAANAERLRNELETHQAQATRWREAARDALKQGREGEARTALGRKQEVDDVAAGLSQEYAAATATREHLATTGRALAARLADARRKRSELAGQVTATEAPMLLAVAPPMADSSIEDELAALKRELESS